MTQAAFEQTLADLSALALPVLVLAALTSALVLYTVRALGSPVPRTLGTLPVAFAILGGICGVIAGASTETLVGALVTGVLGLVSALLSYAFTRDQNSNIGRALPAIVILLLINALIGLSVGQNWRKKWDDYEMDLAEQRIDYKEIWVPVTKEFQLQVLRRCLAESKGFEDARKRCSYESLFPASEDRPPPTGPSGTVR